ncbi:MAG TPA: FkbM family methyltransferase [Desulfovibrio sp.]|jgi:FkbM family methyltransferase|nr:FkbM family methyltransferase [Desulfovibrio sp.]
MNQPVHAANFAAALVAAVLGSLRTVHTDNHQRFYQLGDRSAQLEDLHALENAPQLTAEEVFATRREIFEREVATKSLLHSLLADASSRDLLVQLAAFAMLGHRRVRLPYHGPRNAALRGELLRSADRSAQADADLVAAIQEKWTTDVFSLFEIDTEEGPLRVYTIGEELYRTVHAPSYSWGSEGQAVGVRPGDMVLDCGAAFGDVSLQFARAVGEQGHVICFEPYPLFLRVYNENMRMNPRLADRTTLVQRGVWHKPDETLSFIAGGGGSRIDQSNHAPLKIHTTTIDEVCAAASLPRVDFIKMDIEGAELNALRGAERTLRRFRPRLAICLYHSPQDFHDIPAYLHGLGLDYRLHLNHHYVNEWETVLYASPA